jgi:CRISPR-associated protein Cas1
MKKHLNTLFVTTQGAYLAKEGETVTVKVEKKVALRLPVHTLDGIVCFGNVAVSPFLMGFCAERDVAISFLSEQGRFLARVQGPVSGNVLLRRRQYRLADEDGSSAGLATNMVAAKVANCRYVLQRARRDHADKLVDGTLDGAIKRLNAALDRLTTALPLDEVRGLEGECAHVYFQAFDNVITRQKADFFFAKRSRRPPLDRLNCLLSFVYTLLMHDIRSALESVGLDPAVGFLHRDRPGRSGLALDMMEEFRPLADRVVLSLVNRGQVAPSGFTVGGSGGVTMDNETRKTLLVAWQQRKQEGRLHPFLEEKMEFGLFFYAQALLLARYLRGDLDGYPPVIWR